MIKNAFILLLLGAFAGGYFAERFLRVQAELRADAFQDALNRHVQHRDIQARVKRDVTFLRKAADELLAK